MELIVQGSWIHCDQERAKFSLRGLVSSDFVFFLFLPISYFLLFILPAHIFQNFNVHLFLNSEII